MEKSIAHPHVYTLVAVCIKVFDRPANNQMFKVCFKIFEMKVLFVQNCANLMFCQIYCARAFKQLNTCTASCEIVAFTTYSVSLYSLTSPLTLFGPGLAWSR